MSTMTFRVKIVLYNTVSRNKHYYMKFRYEIDEPWYALDHAIKSLKYIIEQKDLTFDYELIDYNEDEMYGYASLTFDSKSYAMYTINNKQSILDYCGKYTYNDGFSQYTACIVEQQMVT